jgi:hypothetical protein
MKRTLPFFAALLTLAGLLGCNNTPSTADALTTYCTALTAYNQSVATLNGLGATATVGQYKEAVKAVQANYDAVAAAAKDVRDAKTDALKTATDDLQKTINGIPDSATAAQAVAMVAPKVQAVQSTVQQNRTAVKCP